MRKTLIIGLAALILLIIPITESIEVCEYADDVCFCYQPDTVSYFPEELTCGTGHRETNTQTGGDGRELSFYMWLWDPYTDVAKGSNINPRKTASGKDPNFVFNYGEEMNCIDTYDNQLLEECFMDGLYDACIRLEGEASNIGGLHKICMRYYYTNPDEHHSTNINAEDQCSSIVNKNPSNIPLVWIDNGAEDGYDKDYSVDRQELEDSLEETFGHKDYADIKDIKVRYNVTIMEGPQMCCGDDTPNEEDLPTDSGRMSYNTDDPRGGKYLCAQDKYGRWMWLDKRKNAGQVFSIAHGGYDALSTNSTWYLCDSLGDDCDDGTICEVGAGKGFPHEKKEIKSSFWEYMGSDHIKHNLESQKVNFISQMNDYICTEAYNYEEFVECAGAPGTPPKNYNTGTYGDSKFTGSVVPVVDNFEDSAMWVEDNIDAHGSNQVYTSVTNLHRCLCYSS
jgi:hypothetical protein